MTIIVPIDEAKAMLAELCARARDGEEVVLTENGTPVGRLGPIEPSTPIAPASARWGSSGTKCVSTMTSTIRCRISDAGSFRASHHHFTPSSPRRRGSTLSAMLLQWDRGSPPARG
ncbi:MAG TPA: type II toxin-antitoxin system prevent-host-death family antitoxin [Azospirillum sp.]